MMPIMLLQKGYSEITDILLILIAVFCLLLALEHFVTWLKRRRTTHHGDSEGLMNEHPQNGIV